MGTSGAVHRRTCYKGAMKTLLLLASAAILTATSPALAKPGKGHGNPHAVKGHNAHAGHVGYGNGGCPPGLAKKKKGCLSPGHAKKIFQLGQPPRHGSQTHT